MVLILRRLLPLARIWASINETNITSLRVAEKCGFQYVQSDTYELDGEAKTIELWVFEPPVSSPSHPVTSAFSFGGWAYHLKRVTSSEGHESQQINPLANAPE